MHQPTLRVLQVLDQIAHRGNGHRLADLSRSLNIPKSTLLPILQTLCAHNYLSLDDYGRYGAGTALFSLGATFSGSFPVLSYVRRKLEALVEILGETCYFGILEKGQVLYLEKQDSPQPLRMLTAPGQRLPAYATGIGKALLMDTGIDALRALYPEGLAPITPNTITDPEQLFTQLLQAKKDGYTWELEESTPHVRCFAVPVRKNDTIVAAISVSIPTFRYDDRKKDAILAALQSTAAAISETICQTDAHFGNAF